ncbi:MAG: aminoacyl-histidine dipeptidase [Eubacteriales bacterium]|nr:aminoacyl-histidine dipeptidase [Eubacteriales bacterium]
MGKEERIERMIPAGIEPKVVFKIFEEISRIPRASGHEERISNWLVDFADKYGLEHIQDQKGNVLIRKPGSPGKENHPAVILQSHMDMVCEKIPDSQHDFQRNPIRITVNGDKILAQETTLGADDGIGMALSLALLTLEDIVHPPLEVLITVDEEIGLTGAEEFDASQLKGKYFINLDSGDEGVFVAGSAGGPTICADIPLSWKEPEAHSEAYKLTVEGLLGGHSGEDIHRNRGNANKLLFRLLDALERAGAIEVASILGGMAGNAIPRSAEAVVVIPSEDFKTIRKEIENYQEIYREEYRMSDPGITVTCRPLEEEVSRVFTKESMERIVDFGVFCENGILRMSPDVEGVVESSNNLGSVTTEEEKVSFVFVTRSFRASAYQEMVLKIDRLARSVEGSSHKEYDCLEWPYEPESEIRNIFLETYRDLFREEAKAIPVHTGLECGIIAKNIGRPVDMISVGPETKEMHKPGEWFSISSTQKYWKLLLEVLNRL